MFSAKDDKGVQIRVPATANLMVDSADRSNVYPNPFDFQIVKKNSILNGFFNRIATSEVVLEWCEPNGAYMPPLSTVWSTVNIQVDFSPLSFYNVEQALGELTSTISSSGGDVKVEKDPLTNANALVSASLSDFNFVGDLTSANKLGIDAPGTAAPNHAINCPDLRPFRYIDMTSEQLTYNQELKDSTTAPVVRDVLNRWYFAWDNQPSTDGLGYPIEMGYEPFKLRRLYNPPKQIKWNSDQPLGNISFQVYGSGCNAPIQSVNNDSQFLLTLQVSEN